MEGRGAEFNSGVSPEAVVAPEPAQVVNQIETSVTSTEKQPEKTTKAVSRWRDTAFWHRLVTDVRFQRELSGFGLSTLATLTHLGSISEIAIVARAALATVASAQAGKEIGYKTGINKEVRGVKEETERLVAEAEELANKEKAGETIDESIKAELAAKLNEVYNKQLAIKEAERRMELYGTLNTEQNKEGSWVGRAADRIRSIFSRETTAENAEDLKGLDKARRIVALGVGTVSAILKSKEGRMALLKGVGISAGVITASLLSPYGAPIIFGAMAVHRGMRLRNVGNEIYEAYLKSKEQSDIGERVKNDETASKLIEVMRSSQLGVEPMDIDQVDPEILEAVMSGNLARIRQAVDKRAGQYQMFGGLLGLSVSGLSAWNRIYHNQTQGETLAPRAHASEIETKSGPPVLPKSAPTGGPLISNHDQPNPKPPHGGKLHITSGEPVAPKSAPPGVEQAAGTSPIEHRTAPVSHEGVTAAKDPELKDLLPADKATAHNFGEIYEEGGKKYVMLDLIGDGEKRVNEVFEIKPHLGHEVIIIHHFDLNGDGVAERLPDGQSVRIYMDMKTPAGGYIGELLEKNGGTDDVKEQIYAIHKDDYMRNKLGAAEWDRIRSENSSNTVGTDTKGWGFVARRGMIGTIGDKGPEIQIRANWPDTNMTGEYHGVKIVFESTAPRTDYDTLWSQMGKIKPLDDYNRGFLNTYCQSIPIFYPDKTIEFKYFDLTSGEDSIKHLVNLLDTPEFQNSLSKDIRDSILRIERSPAALHDIIAGHTERTVSLEEIKKAADSIIFPEDKDLAHYPGIRYDAAQFRDLANQAKDKGQGSMSLTEAADRAATEADQGHLKGVVVNKMDGCDITFARVILNNKTFGSNEVLVYELPANFGETN